MVGKERRKQLTLVVAGASMAFSAKSPPCCLRQVSQRDNCPADQNMNRPRALPAPHGPDCTCTNKPGLSSGGEPERACIADANVLSWHTNHG